MDDEVRTFLSNKKVDEIRNNEVLLQLSIPSINVEEDVYTMGSVLNDVDYHVQILKESDINHNRLFLAGHSGYGDANYFNDLFDLETGDFIWVIYDNYKVCYQVVDSYYIVKNGMLYVEEFLDNHIYLITCSVTMNDRQLVVVGEMIYDDKLSS